MAYYYSVHWWIQCYINKHDVLNKIKSLYEAYATKQATVYASGWCTSEATLNSTDYVFYGGDTQSEGLLMLEDALSQIASMEPDICAYFHVQGEDAETCFSYTLFHGQVTVAPASPLFTEVD